MRILSIDPGGTTGLCIADTNLPMAYWTTEAQKNHLQVWAYIEIMDWDYVIVENFIGTNMLNAARQLTIRIIGGAEALCRLHGKKYCLHTPQEKLAYMDEARHELNRRKQKHQEHEVDALAQVLAHIGFNHK